MAGVDLPVVALEHHYLLTEDLSAAQEQRRVEMPLVLDLDGEIYLRQERKRSTCSVFTKKMRLHGPSMGRLGITASSELLPPAPRSH